MSNEKYYSVNEICKLLKISNATFANWYRWERKMKRDNPDYVSVLPEPIRQMDMRGKPRRFTSEQLTTIKEFKRNIVVGRKGIYGKYSNPSYKGE